MIAFKDLKKQLNLDFVKEINFANIKQMMKRLLALFIFGVIGLGAKAQIQITYSGNVGIGIDPLYIGCKLRVAYGGNDFAFMPSWAGINFGGYNASDKNATRIDFWHPIAGWNKVRFKGYTLSSDSGLKTDIVPLKNATDLLKQIKTYSYYFKSDCGEDRKRDYGVLAQEIEKILPELVDTAKGNMFVNYNAFFGILIKGFNEQQEIIEQQKREIKMLQHVAFPQEFDMTEMYEMYELRNDINDLRKTVDILRETISNCCQTDIRPKSNATQSPNDNQNGIPETAVLYQNTPNPFSSNTEISCYIPTLNNKAFIYVYNLQGLELKAFSITQIGHSTVTISASDLSAGMYLYTLVVDNEIVDSKRMILTK